VTQFWTGIRSRPTVAARFKMITENAADIGELDV
jgi:hypothetical protein